MRERARSGRRPADQPGLPEVVTIQYGVSAIKFIGETPMKATGTVALPDFKLNRSG